MERNSRVGCSTSNDRRKKKCQTKNISRCKFFQRDSIFDSLCSNSRHFFQSSDEHTGSIKRRRRTISSTTKAASACLKRAKRKSSDGVRLCLKNQRPQIEIENVLDLNSSNDILSTLKEKSSPISDTHSIDTKV